MEHIITSAIMSHLEKKEKTISWATWQLIGYIDKTTEKSE